MDQRSCKKQQHRIGEAKPDESMTADIPSNPIQWSLSLVPGGGAVSAFGGGYFDDAGVCARPCLRHASVMSVRSIEPDE